MAEIITFDVEEFRAAYPAFANETTFPDATLQQWWDTATCYISDENYGCLRDACRRLAINLMTAHLTALSVLIAAGSTGTITQSATIDKITVTNTPPPVTDNNNQFNWWLSTTPYGAQLLALLQVQSVGGFYVGGSPVRDSFNNGITYPAGLYGW